MLLNLLPKTADAADSRLRAVEWAHCLSAITEAEATTVVREDLGMLPREQRRQQFTPGDVAEAVYTRRRQPKPSAGALPAGPPCEHCDGTGFERIERAGVERAVTCRCRKNARP